MAPRRPGMVLIPCMAHWLRPLLLVLLPLLLPAEAYSERFVLTDERDSVVGELRSTYSRKDDTLIDIAREFDLGYDQIIAANPGVNRWIPGDGTNVTLPNLYILPGTARRGLVLNIADLRLYYYPTPKKGAPQEVITYPVSIGRMDWRTPLGMTRVVAKEKDPAWRPPPSIRLEHERDGDPLPAVIPGGSPDNPLGRFALRLGIPSYLIHGVDERKSFGIGMRVTHGCIRMYPEDIEDLFGLVSVNTPVLLVDEPIKVGQRGDRIFLSVHQPLDEGENDDAPPLARTSLETVVQHLRKHLGPEVIIDQELVAKITEEGDGIPYEIGQGTLRSKPTQSQQRVEVSQPSRGKSTLDIEYEQAIARHLGSASAPERPISRDSGRAEKSPATRQVPRRAPLSQTDSDEDDRVRRYLEERY